MAERSDLPRIKPDEQPSIFNHEAGKWGYLSALIAGLVAMPFTIGENIRLIAKNAKSYSSQEKLLAETLAANKQASIFVLAAEIGGTLLGGLRGKQQQEKEQVEGRIVKEPGYLNKGILTGLTVSSLLQAPLVFMQDKPDFLKKISGLPVQISLVMMPLVAMTIGSIMRRDGLQRDFDKSLIVRRKEREEAAEMKETLKAAEAAKHHEKPHDTHHTPKEEASYKNSVNAEEAAALEAKEKPHHRHAEKHLAQAHASSPMAAAATLEPKKSLSHAEHHLHQRHAETAEAHQRA